MPSRRAAAASATPPVGAAPARARPTARPANRRCFCQTANAHSPASATGLTIATATMTAILKPFLRSTLTLCFTLHLLRLPTGIPFGLLRVQRSRKRWGDSSPASPATAPVSAFRCRQARLWHTAKAKPPPAQKSPFRSRSTKHFTRTFPPFLTQSSTRAPTPTADH